MNDWRFAGCSRINAVLSGVIDTFAIGYLRSVHLHLYCGGFVCIFCPRGALYDFLIKCMTVRAMEYKLQRN